jgi:hypothetical protein
MMELSNFDAIQREIQPGSSPIKGLEGLEGLPR